MTAICDLHNHILPGMDDGCATLEDSLAVLASAACQGIHHVIATPHYYAEEPLEEFLRRRDASEALLRENLPEDIRLCVGAEVAWFNGISRCEQLESLCIGKSRFMLLEMPFTTWDSNLFRELRNLCHIRGIIPIIAHIERYLHIQSKTAVQELLKNDVLVQMNAEYLLKATTAFHARILLKKGIVQLLGTDCHNLSTRPFNLGRVAEKMKKQGLSKQLAQAAAMSMDVFSEASGSCNEDRVRKENG